MRSSQRYAPQATESSAFRGGLHARLRAETSTWHHHVERQLDLLDPDLTVEQYKSIIAAFYGYYEPLEARLAAVAWSPEGLALVPRAPLLRQDLAALGFAPQAFTELPRCVELPPIAQPADVAGCLYVIEGAVLGGRIISRAIEERLGIGKGDGGAFFAGTGSGTMARWRLVLTRIEELARTERCDDAIVGAACTTFQTIARWFEGYRSRA